jgi:2-polyprenyl-3-methyl-5-hydroxy-6-metoxy-1,4-benzoquinol methylase
VSEVNGGIVMDVPIVSVLEHYEKLIEEGNDPVHDSKVMQEYMNRWGGSEFFRALGSCTNKRVLEVGVGTGRLAKTILDKGCKHFTGIDISPKTIERAKMNLSRFKNCKYPQQNGDICMNIHIYPSPFPDYPFFSYFILRR